MLKTLCIKACLIIKDTFLLYVSLCSIHRVRIADKIRYFFIQKIIKKAEKLKMRFIF